MTILVTGGAGFIGSNFIRHWLSTSEEPVVNLDKLTYAGNPLNLAEFDGDPRHVLVHGDIVDGAVTGQLLAAHRPRAILHFAAESHVDRSIHGPGEFIRTNISGTFALLEQALAYWRSLDDAGRARFRFLHVSTDEVYGSLSPEAPAFSETNAYEPNSPYAASKAAADHLVRAWGCTYGLPVITTHCSNNYGPCHYPEKLIPLVILNAIGGKRLPVYGDGMQVRDWLYVDDHCQALTLVLGRGRTGQTYNIGGSNERRNIDVVRTICAILDELQPRADGLSYSERIQFVTDRQGHDRRYAIDAGKIERELGWRPAETFETGLRKTVSWYLRNQRWVDETLSGAYLDWMQSHYTRLKGVGATAREAVS